MVYSLKKKKKGQKKGGGTVTGRATAFSLCPLDTLFSRTDSGAVKAALQEKSPCTFLKCKRQEDEAQGLGMRRAEIPITKLRKHITHLH